MKKYSVDKLLKKQPKKLKAFKFETNDLGNRFVEMNGVLVWANKYEIVYDNLYIMLKFFKSDKLVASVEAFGSSDCKKDEAFIIDDFRIISETSYRVMKMNIKRAKRKNK